MFENRGLRRIFGPKTEELGVNEDKENYLIAD
jgi:hypothetical protein